MRRIITLTAMALGLSSGVALADRHHGGNLGDRSGGVVVRDHRGGFVNGNRGSWSNRGSYTRSYDRGYNRGYVRPAVTVTRRPVFATNGRFYFGGNTYRTYQRPVIDVRYRNYYQRPALIVENYDPVPGYVWNPGQWEWNGYEWKWIGGHYDVDAALHTHVAYDGDQDDAPCDHGTYDSSYRDTSGYYDNSY